MKKHHISEAGVSFEIQFGLCIKIWAGEHIFHIWQQTIALNSRFCVLRNQRFDEKNLGFLLFFSFK